MSDPERLLKSGKNDAATLLLQSALPDRAPNGAKARALKALGLSTLVHNTTGAPDTAPMGRTSLQAKRASLIVSIANTNASAGQPKAEAPRLFRSVLDESSLMSAFGAKGRMGLGLVVVMQAAAVVLLLLVPPTRQPDSQTQVAAAPRGIDVDMMQPTAPTEKPGPAALPQSPTKTQPAAAHAKAPAAPSDEPQIGVSVGEVVSTTENMPPAAAPALEVKKPTAPLAEPTKTTAVPLEWMTRPKRIEGRDPQYTAAAREARVEGTAIVQCEVTKTGLTRDCKVLKSLPHMEQELLSAASTWRFTPATADGQPMTTRASFTITLVLPKL